eukprot:8459299-Pyramimonas_sp.AAC.1
MRCYFDGPITCSWSATATNSNLWRLIALKSVSRRSTILVPARPATSAVASAAPSAGDGTTWPTGPAASSGEAATMAPPAPLAPSTSS